METQATLFKTSPVRVIAVDLDGTLLNNEHKLSKRNQEALQVAIAQGVQVILATGKTRTSAEKLIQTLNLTTPGIFVQGLMTYNGDGTVKHQQTMNIALARRIITFAEDRGFQVMAYSGNRILIKKSDPILMKVVDYGEPTPEIVGPLVNLLDKVSINKLIVGGDDKRIKAIRWQLEQQISGQVTFTSAQVGGLLEILPANTSKGKALKTLLHDLGIPAEQVLAIGDGENDIDMIKLAGIGVAVGNAFEGLKAVAKHVVSSNQDHGVAEAIERFVLPPKQPDPITVAAPAAETPPKIETPAVVTPPTPTPAAVAPEDTPLPKPTSEEEAK